MKKCYIYTRVSTAAQIDGYSLEAQMQSLKEYAEYRELQIAGSYQDAGKSGKNIKGRPAFQQMMADVMAQKDDISFILVFKLSRFGRNAADILKSLQTLEDYGVDLVSVEESIDSSTQGGRLTLAILSAVAEMERENITVQFMAGRMQKAVEGGFTGGSAPFGYRNQDHSLVVDETEAELVRRIYELYRQDGMLATSVASELNRLGCTRRGKDGRQIPLTYEFVARILDNPFYCGRLCYNRRTNKKDRDGRTIHLDPANIISVKGIHEPIVTEAVWDEVHEKRVAVAGKYKHTKAQDHVHLLSGIVKCPICGKGLVGLTSRNRSPYNGEYYKPIFYYGCAYNSRQRGCTCTFSKKLNEEIVDGLVLKIIDGLQTYKNFRTSLEVAFGDKDTLEKTQVKLQKLRQELRDAEVSKDRLGEKLDGLNPLRPDYDKKYAAFSEQLDLLYDRIDELEDQVSSTMKHYEALKQKSDSAVQVMEFLKNLNLIYEEMSGEERKEMFRSFIDSIELFPEDRSDGKLIKSMSFRFGLVFDGKPLAKVENGEDTVSFTLDCSDMDLSLPENGNIILKKQQDGSRKVIVRKATYSAIKEYILEKHGVKVSTLYVAQIKRKYGLKIGKAYNKPEVNKGRVPNCPKEKELLIMEALKSFGLLEQAVEYREEQA